MVGELNLSQILKHCLTGKSFRPGSSVPQLYPVAGTCGFRDLTTSFTVTEEDFPYLKIDLPDFGVRIRGYISHPLRILYTQKIHSSLIFLKFETAIAESSRGPSSLCCESALVVES